MRLVLAADHEGVALPIDVVEWIRSLGGRTDGTSVARDLSPMALGVRFISDERRHSRLSKVAAIANGECA